MYGLSCNNSIVKSNICLLYLKWAQDKRSRPPGEWTYERRRGEKWAACGCRTKTGSWMVEVIGWSSRKWVGRHRICSQQYGRRGCSNENYMEAGLYEVAEGNNSVCTVILALLNFGWVWTGKSQRAVMWDPSLALIVVRLVVRFMLSSVLAVRTWQIPITWSMYIL